VVVVPKFWKIFLGCNKGHDLAKGHRVAMPILCLGMLPDFAFFKGVFGLCVWLGIEFRLFWDFCGLKEGFCEDHRYGFFWVLV